MLFHFLVTRFVKSKSETDTDQSQPSNKYLFNLPDLSNSKKSSQIYFFQRQVNLTVNSRLNDLIVGKSELNKSNFFFNFVNTAPGYLAYLSKEWRELTILSIGAVNCYFRKQQY